LFRIFNLAGMMEINNLLPFQRYRYSDICWSFRFWVFTRVSTATLLFQWKHNIRYFYDLTLREFYSILPRNLDNYLGIEPNILLI
jgi:hypothetical protein